MSRMYAWKSRWFVPYLEGTKRGVRRGRTRVKMSSILTSGERCCSQRRRLKSQLKGVVQITGKEAHKSGLFSGQVASKSCKKRRGKVSDASRVHIGMKKRDPQVATAFLRASYPEQHFRAGCQERRSLAAQTAESKGCSLIARPCWLDRRCWA
jgi:hypothetical protein